MFYRYMLRVARNIPGGYPGSTFTVLDVVDRFISLSYRKRLNEPGYLTAQFERDDAIFDSLQLDDVVQVVRGKKTDITTPYYSMANYIDFEGLYRGDGIEFRDGVDLRTITCMDGIGLMQRSIIGYPANKGGYNSWQNTAVSQIAYDIIYRNMATPLPVFYNRLLAGSGYRMEANWTNPFGSVINYSAAYKSVYDAVAELAQIDKLDFWTELIFTGEGFFCRLAPLAGTDKSATVHFHVGRGNMLRPTLQRLHNEPTIVLAAGQGESAQRVTVVRQAANYSLYTNHSEMFVDARHLSDTSALQAWGDSKLQAKAFKNRLTYEAMQTLDCVYGKHYVIGDKITAIYADVALVQKIVGVTVTVTPEGERIQLELVDG